MKVSIVIPVYNVEKYIRECIDSVINQSYRCIEIILVNDGSTDNSQELCKEYELNYSYLKLINKENGGLSDARNVGILHATGDYIIFLDSDDYWDDPHFLFDLVECIKKNQELDYLFFRYKFFFQQKDTCIEPIFEIDEKKLLGKTGIECLDYILENMSNFQWFAWMGMIRRAFILEHDLFFIKGRNYEDMLWTPQVFMKAKSIGFYDKAAYVYRLEREGQITSDVSYKNLEDNLFVCTYWFNYLKDYPIKNKLKKKLLTNINMRYFYVIKFAAFLNRNDTRRLIKSLKKNKNLLKYSDGKNLIILFLCNLIGFTVTSQLLYKVIKYNRIYKGK